jgi:hypothetical protein
LPQARQLRGELVFGWVYPPLLALVLQPLAGLDDAAALGVWMLLQWVAAGALLFACRQALRACGRWTSWAGAVALCVPSLPLLHAIKWGQVSTFVAAGAVWALCGAAWRRDGEGARDAGGGASAGARTRAGATLGVLAALKLYPAAYVVLAVLRRELRTLAWAAGTALALGIVVPLVVLGPATTWRYFAAALAVRWDIVGYLGGQALWPTLVRLLVTRRHTGLESEGNSPLLLSLGSVGTDSAAALARTWLLMLPALALGAVTLRALWRARHAASTRAETALLLLVAIALCLAPGWHHYFAFLPVAMAVLLGHPRCTPRRGALVAVAWLMTALPVFALARGPESYLRASQWGCTTWAALAVWWALFDVAGRAPDSQRPDSGHRRDLHHAGG